MNNRVDLAIFGAEPAFAEKLHVGRPNIGDRAKLLERVNNILDARVIRTALESADEIQKRLNAKPAA